MAERTPCSLDPIVFGAIAENTVQNVFQPAQTITWTDTLIVSPTPCAPTAFTLEDSFTGLPLDSSIFTESLSLTTNSLTFATNDPFKVGVYNVRIKAKFQNYLINSGFKDI